MKIKLYAAKLEPTPIRSTASRSRATSIAGATGLAIISGLSTAGYAFGALAGGDIIQRFLQRRPFLVYEALFVLGCGLAAAAGGIVVYGAGRVLQGLASGFFLVTALPPVVQRFPPGRLPITAAAINIGFFGATVIGALLGGVAAHRHAWRWFYIALALLGALTFLLAVLTLPDQKPPNPGARFDAPGLALVFAATALPFWAVDELTGHTAFYPCCHQKQNTPHVRLSRSRLAGRPLRSVNGRRALRGSRHSSGNN